MHNIISARYAELEPSGGYNPDAAVIVTRLNGTTEYRRANDDIDGGGMQAFLAQGGVIDLYVPPTESEDSKRQKIRLEASQRMQAVVGARDVTHLEIIISNASREAIRLLRIGESNWSNEQRQRATELEQVDIAIEAIRARSNTLEADPPNNYADDKHWP